MIRQPTRLLVTLALVGVALAGCTDTSEPTTPELALGADRDEATAGETIEFQAIAKEHDGDAAYVFDFGDGETARVEGGSSVDATHAYEQGGTYTVTVEMLEGNETIASAAEEVHVFVTETHDAQVVASSPLANETATASWDIPSENATSVMTGLEVENTAFVGGASIRLELRDGDEVLLAKNVTVPSGEVRNVSLELTLVDVDDLRLYAVAEDGSASIDGESVVRYD